MMWLCVGTQELEGNARRKADVDDVVTSGSVEV
jgi:hypothetical protein